MGETIEGDFIMKDKIISLRGDAPIGSGIVNDELVDILRTLLGQAERGELVAMIWGGVRPTRNITHGWNGAERGYTFELMAACQSVNYRLLRAHMPEENDLEDA